MPQISFFDELKRSAEPAWTRYTTHPFVQQLGQGTLDPQAFRHYLIQDYLFLIHFARAFALAAFKGETLEDIRMGAQGLSGIVDVEMSLHIEYCASYGLSAADLESAPEGMATTAYTRFVIDRGLNGDLLDLYVALSPCMIGYAEIGLAIAADPQFDASVNPYSSWVEMYASQDFQNYANAQGEYLQSLFERRGSPRRMHQLIAIFEQASDLEAKFWQMGLDAAADSAA